MLVGWKPSDHAIGEGSFANLLFSDEEPFKGLAATALALTRPTGKGDQDGYRTSNP